MADQMAVLQQLLLATLDPRPSVRQAAEQQLTAARQTDLGQFVGSMAALIALEQPPQGPQGAPGSPEDLLIAKQIAAVTFKNSISAKVRHKTGIADDAITYESNEMAGEVRSGGAALLQHTALCRYVERILYIGLALLMQDMSLDGAAAQAWRALPGQTKTEIKKQLLAALQTDCTQVCIDRSSHPKACLVLCLTVIGNM